MLGHALNLARHVAHKLATAQLRSPKWRAVEKRWLREHPACIACGGRHFLAVHHVVPFQHDPSRELDEANLETFCVTHHLLVAHGDSWRTYCASVRELCRSVRAGQLTLAEAAVIAKRERVPIRTSVP